METNSIRLGIGKIPKTLKTVFLTLFLYALPFIALLAWLAITGERPWTKPPVEINIPILKVVFENLSSWGLPVIILALGLAEFALGLYDKRWNTNEKLLDITCFVLPKLILYPATAYFTLKALPNLFPHLHNSFSWIPFWWALAIIAVADDLTQYWYHRLHHEVPFLWRFHRTHHSAPYMGMAMASRQNIIYTFFFSQIYVTATLVYFGLGIPALIVKGVKSLITTFAHSSVKWDKPFYDNRWLHPIAWVLERVISTPATHHAHHADSTDDGVGHYKGNFGNMFFLWDLIFGTGLITRQYPEAYGVKSYQHEEWYAQLAWPFFKSKKEGSELAAGAPEYITDEDAIAYKLKQNVQQASV